MKITCAAVSLFALLSTVFGACRAQWTTIREGTWNGQRYTVQERSRSGAFASTNSLDWRIKLGKMPAVPVDAVTTDWGPPYSTDIYGAESYLFITDKDTAYSNAPFTPGTIGVAHTMLYISPRTLDGGQYEILYNFMKDRWPALSDSLVGTDLRGFPHIIGLVYGKQKTFAEDFKGTYNGKKMIIRIEPDGRVRFMDDDKWAAESYSGLSSKVEMPGKILRLQAPGTPQAGLTLDQLRAFRNQYDRPLEVRFEIVMDRAGALTR